MSALKVAMSSSHANVLLAALCVMGMALPTTAKSGCTASQYNEFASIVNSLGSAGMAHAQSTIQMSPTLAAKNLCNPSLNHTTIRTLFSIKSIDAIDTKAKTFEATFNPFFLWTMPLAGCSTWGTSAQMTSDECEAYLPTGCDPASHTSTCSVGIQQVGPSSACYLHPSGTTPQSWQSSISFQNGKAAPIACNSEATGPLQIQSFKEQFWYPKPKVFKALAHYTRILSENFRVQVAPNAKVNLCGRDPYAWYTKTMQVTTKQTFDLTKYPFDVQNFQINLYSPDSEPPPYFKYRKFPPNTAGPSQEERLELLQCATGSVFTTIPNTEELNADFVGSTVSGFTILAVTSASAQTTTATGVGLNVIARRIASQLVWTYIVPAVVVWFCSWLLLFVQTSIPPALAGTVTAQVVLLLITVNQQVAVIHGLPAGTNTVYLTGCLQTSMFQQIAQLVYHLVRMAVVVAKQEVWLDYFTKMGIWVFMTTFLVSQGAVLWSYFGLDDGWCIFFLVMSIVSTIATAIRLGFYHHARSLVEKAKIAKLTANALIHTEIMSQDGDKIKSAVQL